MFRPSRVREISWCICIGKRDFWVRNVFVGSALRTVLLNREEDGPQCGPYKKLNMESRTVI